MAFPRVLRDLTARLTDPVEVLDAADLAGRVQRTGCARVADVSRGDLATLTGRIRTVLTGGGPEVLGLTAEVFDGTGAIEVCWLGRRSIPGIDTGRFIRVTGRVGDRDGRRIMFNPRYALLDGQPCRTVEESRDRA
ncbi:hypothetical protein [Dietzia sp. CH92]|uniref:OB-fold nucleic acid binding domain-containing protein n=1 Tax=Dietzia sp. CH92 TaxID=3051823 RepID=UPI0028D47012|nr:hypothetical protein [Dietzia sp. CH92]